jgi:glyoxylase-like metal-dependent hydrolase (beta-lactamase superfamily II)/8-oxo-dGTP pyrophosphatase MutT (NUDIX family)
MTTAPPPAAVPRLSSTVAVVRDGAAGIEVLLLRRRTAGTDLYSDSWVFPGGSVDAADADAMRFSAPIDPGNARHLPADTAGALIAATVRECFEEAGLWLGDGAAPADPWRMQLQQGDTTLAAVCAAEGARFDPARIAAFAHWLTPVGLPKRFDTWFFVAATPPGQQARHDEAETVDFAWMTPADALARGRELKLALPTQKSLEDIGRCADVAALFDWARALPEVPLIAPHLGTGPDGRKPVLPWAPAWAELRRIDPEGRGDQRSDIVPGRAVRLSERVIRISANNGSVMTGPGTNTYLVGGGPANRWAAIDPGPRDERHVQAILDAAPGPIDRILVTHTHHDHSPAAALLKQRTGAALLGQVAAHTEWQDTGFVPEVALGDGDVLALDGATLRVVHTPGHASNHLCFLLDEEKLLFTGDHLMQLSTVVINPPDGDMGAYLDALRRLLALELDWLAPGHGFLMAEPRRVIEHVIAHRLKREAKVIEAMRAAGACTIETLLPRVYDDVPEKLHPMALRSLRAHLFKLRDDGLAEEAGERWGLSVA